MNENQKKIPVWMIALIVALFAALTVVVVLLVVNGKEDAPESTKATLEEELESDDPEAPIYSYSPEDEETADDPTDSEEPESTEPKAPAVEGYGSNDPTALDNYSILTAAPGDVDMEKVIAINENGDACLTNGELQIYYWIEFYNFMNSYGSYASMMGLDANTPLNLQQSMQEGSTWEQYFLESAAKHYAENYALAQSAIENGYTISEEDAKNIEDMGDPNGEFAAEAKEYNFDSVEAYLQANFGKGVGVADYQNYLRTYYAAYHYYNQQSEEMKAAVSEEDVIKHYDENAETFAGQGLSKVNNVAVRHLLIGVEGEADENGEYPEEAWKTAETKANELYEQWLENPTEDNFAEMAKEHTTDPGSKETGGLYDDVYPGQMVTEFNDWCFDGSRKTGDHGIVKTSYGYHIMYFVKQNETRKWYDAALEDMMGTKLNAMLDELVEQYPVKFDYTKVRLYDMISNNAAPEASE